MTRAIFIYLDGVIITTNSGKLYPLHSSDWRLITEIVSFVEEKYLKGYKVFLISNQEAVFKGYITVKVLENKLLNICKALEKRYKFKPNSINYTYCTDLNSYNTIPKPGIAYELALEYELDLFKSIMIGNTAIHHEFAINSGIATYIDADTIKLDY